MQDIQGFTELLFWLWVRAMLGLLFFPLAHLLFDHARINSVTTGRQFFLADFLDEVVEPLATASFTGGTFRQSAAKDLERVGEGDPIRINVLLSRRFLYNTRMR